MRRRLLIAIVALGLAPGLWWRSAVPSSDPDAPVIATQLPLPSVEGELRVAGLWQLSSADPNFGGLSALVALDERGLLAGSDRGELLHITLSPRAVPQARRMQVGLRMTGKNPLDLEGLTRDPASGAIWASFENWNAIERHEGGGATALVRPTAMRDLPSNAGAETLLRLPSGQFLVLGESANSDGTVPGFLFEADPVSGGEAVLFRFRPRPGYRPTDAALGPDGRVLILQRRVHYRWPIGFSGLVTEADPAEIAPGEEWTAHVLARLSGPVLGENWEGLAVIAGVDGDARIFVVSDDNLSAFQKSLLLELRPGNTTRP